MLGSQGAGGKSKAPPSCTLVSWLAAGHLDSWKRSSPMGFLVALVVKNMPANAGDIRNEGLIPGLGRSSGERNGNPLQYSCLENPMNRGAWQAVVHRVVKSLIRLN